MSSFFGGNAASSSDMQAKKEEVKNRIAQELAVANAQTLINVSHFLSHHSAYQLGSFTHEMNCHGMFRRAED